MKKSIYTFSTFIFLFVLSTSLFCQTSYVNINASGANNGTSWANAYTSLTDALDNATSGDIWIAAGTYTPSDMLTDSTTTFRISNGLNVYGGFNGTESSIDDRDVINNVTTLSADINGDDIAGDFDVNKSDNVQHVLFVDSLISSSVLLDGLTITGGYTGENGGQNESFFAGGGVFTYSTITINNCQFNNNYAARGGAICISNSTGGGNNSLISNCTINQNRSNGQSAGIFAAGVNALKVDNTDFIGNATSRGALQLSFTTASEITDCTFSNNIGVSAEGFGGVIFSWQNRDLSISGCTFNENTGGNGTVMYLDGREVGDTDQTEISISNCSFNDNLALGFGGSCIYTWQIAGLLVKDCQFTNNLGRNGGAVYLDGRALGAINSLRNVFENCEFSNNQASDFGGGVLYNFRTSCTFLACTFKDNTGTNGSHIFFTGDDKQVSIMNSEFTGGLADFGGAHTCYGRNSTYSLVGNTYEDNAASTSGGALIIGFNAEVYIAECNLIGNRSGTGGGISMQNDSMNLVVERSLFQGNNASFNGGGISVAGGHNVSIDATTFDQNVAEIGGGIALGEFDSATEAVFNLSNSVFTNNIVTVQGGAVNLLDVDATISNSIFGNNNTTGYGGAFSTNVTANNELNYSLINCTLAANGGIIGGISQWQDVDNAQLTLTLQNTLLFNNGPNYGIEEGEPTIVSTGGNFISDNSIQAVSLSTDVNAAGNPFFQDIDNLDFHLTAQSPAIDAGIATNAPATDAEGNARVGEVDAGAYEFQESVNTENIIPNNGQLSISPNPASTSINLEIDNLWTGDLSIQIYDALGREIKSINLNKSSGVLTQQVDVSELSPMLYHMVLTDGSRSIVESFLKI